VKYFKSKDSKLLAIGIIKEIALRGIALVGESPIMK